MLLIAGFLVLLFTAFYPLRQLRTGRAEVERAKATLVEQDRERQQLEKRLEELQRPSEVERLARERFGLARPGEVPFIVIPEDGAPEQ